MPTPETEATFECWSSMAALARDTSSIRLGQMVTCNGYRPPALLAKMSSYIERPEPWPRIVYQPNMAEGGIIQRFAEEVIPLLRSTGVAG